MADTFKRLSSNAIKYIENALNQTFMKSLSKSMAEQIVKRTRLGSGVDNSNKKTKLKKLAESTIDQRSRYAENLSEFTTPKRSNLTATGQLLDSVKGSANKTKIQITISGKRNKELSGSKSTLTNAQVANYVSDDRPFFGLTDTERKQFARTIKQQLIKSKKQLLK
jgi:hypothetical protein